MLFKTLAVAVVASTTTALACELQGPDALSRTWRLPLDPDVGRISAVFGLQTHPILGMTRRHDGIAWSAPVGADVSAAGSGRVSFAGRDGELGLVVRIDHGAGWETTYAHLARLADGLVVGRCIGRGERIGAVGSTGLTSGPKLYFEIRQNGRALDPSTLLN